jgi:hypothetical protein
MKEKKKEKEKKKKERCGERKEEIWRVNTFV